MQGIFGHFELQRDYYHATGKSRGHHPVDAALGLEVGYTPALAKLMCLEGADESTYLKAERDLEQTGGITRFGSADSARRSSAIGRAAQHWQERAAQPGSCQHSAAPILYVSADGTGVRMVPEKLAGRNRQASRWHRQDPSGLSGRCV